MNEAVKNISELLFGNYGKTIIIGGKVYVIKAPTIKVIVRSTQYLSKVDIKDNATVQELMKIVSEHSEDIIKGLSCLVAGDTYDYKQKVERISKEMLSGTHAELLQAYFIAFELIVGRDFFAVCQLAMELANLTVKPKS
ncbi:hypothetical protein [uncultured Parabacteroides sp.]|uniref:hypothetical protein n=1 Tax=uncultured Parabacteroides sp. TaxID=512312 RepID=UPI002803C4F0|nr:hypothetical protein [uncultured Parabacteroides sp.]